MEHRLRRGYWIPDLHLYTGIYSILLELIARNCVLRVCVGMKEKEMNRWQSANDGGKRWVEGWNLSRSEEKREYTYATLVDHPLPSIEERKFVNVCNLRISVLKVDRCLCTHVSRPAKQTAALRHPLCMHTHVHHIFCGWIIHFSDRRIDKVPLLHPTECFFFWFVVCIRFDILSHRPLSSTNQR